MRKWTPFICAGCGTLTRGLRSDRVTCSDACRVRAHRSGALRERRAFAQEQGIPLKIFERMAVARTLGVDVEPESELELSDAAQDRINDAFVRELDRQTRAGTVRNNKE